MNDIDLAELMCARLCHDLAGPLGAVATGAELLDEDPDPETARLVAATAASAVVRLRLLRAALGTAGSPRPGTELRALVQAYLDAVSLSSCRFGLVWQVSDGPVAGDVARLILALVLVARDALPRGGDVIIRLAPPSGPDGLGMAVGYRGPSARLDDSSRGVLLGCHPPSDPRAVVAGWASRLVHACGARLEVDEEAEAGWFRV